MKEDRPGREVTQETPAVIAERYEVVRDLGEGGMAIAREVIDRNTGKRLALKSLLAQEPDKMVEASHLFEQEFHTLAQLAHPRIVQVYDFNRDQAGRAYYTMELLDGGDLRELAPLPYRRVCELLADVCSALSLVHSRGLVHRDLTPRNIRCTRDGKGKLIDFGAVLAFGTHKRLVGTPPFCPPEAVTGQELDGRSDLFSLGATAYFALTGRNAFPARNFRDLRDLWDGPLPPPSHYVPEIPQALDQLVLSLLQLEREERPERAATVIERLSAIGGFEVSNQVVEAQSFLSAPTLVGRKRELKLLRKLLVRTQRGRGGSALVDGDSGTGRSRFISATVLEAKLMGVTVARLDATDAGAGPFSATRALIEQLIEAIPDLADRVDHDHRRTLSVLVPSLSASSSSTTPGRQTKPPSLHPAENSMPLRGMRSEIQAAMEALVRAASDARTLLLTVDDLDRLDEPSAALIALLAESAKTQRLLLLVTMHSAALRDAAGALPVVLRYSKTKTLAPIGVEDTESMLGSIFGAMPSLSALTQYLHGVTGGVPGHMMQLAQHLVDRGVLRFENGAWSLVGSLNASGLPKTLDEALKARLARLSPSALRLAQTLALVPQRTIHAHELSSLCDGQPSRQTLRDVDSLVSADIVETDGISYRLKHRTLEAPLRANVDRATEQALQLRLAHLLLARKEYSVLPIYHLIMAGEEARALELLLSEFGSPADGTAANDLVAFAADFPLDLLAAFERLISFAAESGQPRKVSFSIREWIIALVSLITGDGREQLEQVLEQLRRDSGLDLHASLAGQVPEEERLGKALEAAMERFAQTPDTERVLAPFDAIKHLARVSVQALAVYGAHMDQAAVTRIPDLSALAPLSPAIEVIHKNVLATGHLLGGRYQQAIALWQEVLQRLDQPDRAQLDEGHHRYMRLAIVNGIGGVDAALCRTTTLARADEIEADPLFEINAERLRMNYAFRMGDATGAERNRRNVELLRLRSNTPQMFEGAQLVVQAQAYAALDDAVRLEQVLPEIDDMARRIPSWQPIATLARGHYLRMRGELPKALDQFDEVLRTTEPGHSIVWPYAAAGRINVLRLLGQVDDACQEGPNFLKEAVDNQLEHENSIREAWALALSAKGEHGQAEREIAEAVRGWERLDAAGTLLGSALEAGARIALAAEDQERFEIYVARCGSVYRAGRNATLAARHDALLREAKCLLRSSLAPGDFGADHTVVDTVTAQNLQILKSQAARGDYCAERIARQTQASAVYLFLLAEDALRLTGAFGGCPAAELVELVRSYLAAELADGLDTSVAGTASAQFFSTSAWISPTGARLLPLLLTHQDVDGPIVTGVAVAEIDDPVDLIIPTRLLTTLSVGLSQLGDAQGKLSLG